MKREMLNPRVKADDRNLIYRAAEEALLDKTLFRVDAETYSKFIARLDTPLRPNDRLRKTMKVQAPWQ